MSTKITASLMTLQEINLYAQMHEEFPQPDNDNLLNPDYSSLHHKLTQGYVKSTLVHALEAAHLVPQQLWSFEGFRAALDQALEYRQADQIVLALAASDVSRFFIFGDLHGAFHSLARDLTFLHEQGIINNNLIVKSDYYLIFNGNVVDQSPYILETFTVILNLLNKNPDNVIYLPGQHEHRNYWEDYGLKRELMIRAKHLSSEKTPLSSDINRFFASLPQALYLKSYDNSLIQISYYGFDECPLTTDAFTAIEALSSPKPVPIIINKKGGMFVTEPIKALIKGANRSITYQPTDGLQLLSPEKGVTTWSVLSSPTLTFTTIYEFHYDAFARITPLRTISEWSITLYDRDILKKEDFQKHAYNLISGQKFDQVLQAAGIQKEPILLGCTLDLSKTSAALGKRLREGLELRINKENQLSGINGRPIKLIFLDDNYTPRIAKQNVIQLLNVYNTSTILAPLGTPTTEAFLPLAQEGKILILFPYTGAMIFRKPSLKNIAHLRTSYAREAQALVDYAVNILQARKFAIFYQDDSYGHAPLEGARAAFKKHGVTDWLETAYLRNNPNIDEPARKITDFNPDVILFFSTHAPSAALIRKLGINKIANTIFMGISFLTDVFRNFLRSKGLELIMARVIPNPDVPTLQIVQDYQEDMRRFNATSSHSSDSLEGYLNADVLITVLHTIQGPITNEAIIDKIENIKEYPYKGLILNFNPETRELLKDVWIDTGTGEWISSK